MDQNFTMTVTRIAIVVVVLLIVVVIARFLLLRSRRGDADLELHPRHRGSALDKGRPLPPGEFAEFDAQGVEIISKPADKPADGGKKTARLNPSFFSGKKTAKTAPVVGEAPTMNLPLAIMARHGKTFDGRDIERLVRTFGLSRSPGNTYELIAENGRDIFFTLLNIHKPGTFPQNLQDIDAIEGVMMIMQLPVGDDALKSLETFLAMATEMCEAVNGRLCDYSRIPMSDKDLINYRKAAEQFEESYQAWRRKQS